LVTEREDCQDFGQFMGINRAFHLEMARQAGNPMIVDAVSRAHDLLAITRQTLDGIPGRPGAILCEHAAILASIRNRDAAAAEAAVSHHILAPLGAQMRGGSITSDA
jgi:DNA-binding GntR family transcriptional regulator